MLNKVTFVQPFDSKRSPNHSTAPIQHPPTTASRHDVQFFAKSFAPTILN